MKLLYNKSATQEEKQKYFNIGTSSKPVKSYTKDDFLTPGKVAKTFNISIDEAKKMMRTLLIRRAIFILNNHKTQIVVNMGTSSNPYLHPMAVEAFREYLQKERK